MIAGQRRVASYAIMLFSNDAAGRTKPHGGRDQEARQRLVARRAQPSLSFARNGRPQANLMAKPFWCSRPVATCALQKRAIWPGRAARNACPLSRPRKRRCSKHAVGLKKIFHGVEIHLRASSNRLYSALPGW